MLGAERSVRLEHVAAHVECQRRQRDALSGARDLEAAGNVPSLGLAAEVGHGDRVLGSGIRECEPALCVEVEDRGKRNVEVEAP